jgi:hypothetical protein
MLYWVARREFRTTYQQRLKLRSAWFLSILPGSGFARLAVRNRLSKSALRSFGPFSSREAAERTMQAVLGLFQIRYCHDVLVPDPSHPGCIFGEMNQCMRPCQMAVTRDEYAGEVQRLTEFLEGKGKQTLATLKASRDRASDDTDFEEAARLHKELERVKQVAGTRDDLVTDVNSLTGVAITRGIEEGDVVLWPITAGYWQPRLTLNFRSDGPAVRSLDQILREQMSAHLSVVRDHGKRSEEIALLSRWYYSTWRDGSWLAFSRLEDVNYRKLVREVSSLLRAPVR